MGLAHWLILYGSGHHKASTVGQYSSRNVATVSQNVCAHLQKLLRALENRTDIADVQAIPPFDVLLQRGLQGFTPLWDFCK